MRRYSAGQKTVLLIGEKYSSNLGDGVIFEEVRHLLENDYNIVSLDLSGGKTYSHCDSTGCFNKKRFQLMFLKQLVRKKIKRIDQLLPVCDEQIVAKYEKQLDEILRERKIDSIIFAGGQLFMDYFLERIIFTINYADKYNIPVFFNACGVSRSISCRGKKILEDIINSDIVKYVSVRDSFCDIHSIDEKNKVFETYDTAIMCNDFFNGSYKGKKIGLGIMICSNIGINRQIKFWKSIVNYCVKNDLDWELFCNGNPDDYKFGEYILDELHLSKKSIHKRPLNPDELVSTVTCYDRIVSMRLHSLIISYSFNIPFVAISWDKKVNEFCNKIKIDDYCFDFDSDARCIMEAILQMEDGYDAALRSKIEGNINNNIETIKRLINDC